MRAKALFRASLASIWQNCVLERLPELLLAIAELLLMFRQGIDFQLFYPSRNAPLVITPETVQAGPLDPLVIT